MSWRSFLDDVFHWKPRNGSLDKMKQAAKDVGARADSVTASLKRFEAEDDPLGALVHASRNYQHLKRNTPNGSANGRA